MRPNITFEPYTAFMPERVYNKDLYKLITNDFDYEFEPLSKNDVKYWMIYSYPKYSVVIDETDDEFVVNCAKNKKWENKE